MIPGAGDAVDKGAGDLRVVKTLLALKQRYGSRAPPPALVMGEPSGTD